MSMSCHPALAAAIAAADRAEHTVADYAENPSLVQFCRANRRLRAAFRDAFTAFGIPPGKTRDVPTLLAELRAALPPVERELLDG